MANSSLSVFHFPRANRMRNIKYSLRTWYCVFACVLCLNVCMSLSGRHLSLSHLYRRWKCSKHRSSFEWLIDTVCHCKTWINYFALTLMISFSFFLTAVDMSISLFLTLFTVWFLFLSRSFRNVCSVHIMHNRTICVVRTKV